MPFLPGYYFSKEALYKKNENKFNNEKAYYLYLLIRKSEEKIIDLYGTDKIKSPVHLSIGQEAIAVGVSLALKDEDIIFLVITGDMLII